MARCMSASGAVTWDGEYRGFERIFTPPSLSIFMVGVMFPILLFIKTLSRPPSSSVLYDVLYFEFGSGAPVSMHMP